MAEVELGLQGYPAVAGLNVTRIAPGQRQANPGTIAVPSRAALIITEEELASAHLTPRCIVENYLWCDLAQLIAAGGTGKTTMVLFEAIHIVLGRPIWGLQIRSTGWVLIVTAEDQRERLIARLRDMMEAMALSDAERHVVRENVIIWDVTGQAVKLIRAKDGNIDLAAEVDRICAAYREDPPILSIFDPIVSFGVSEQAVNDNEQGLVMAGRRLIRELGCCVRFVHHTGKAAREMTDPKLIDQYSGRGGSALADGTRMTAVMAGIDPTRAEPIEGLSITTEDSLIALVRPKLSYARPQPTIWLRRRGFLFDFKVESHRSAEQRGEEQQARLLSFLEDAISAVPLRHLSQRDIEEGYLSDLSMSRSELRQALTRLRMSGRVRDEELPKELQHGRRRTFIAPVSPAHYPDKRRDEPSP